MGTMKKRTVSGCRSVLSTGKGPGHIIIALRRMRRATQMACGCHVRGSRTSRKRAGQEEVLTARGRTRGSRTGSQSDQSEAEARRGTMMISTHMPRVPLDMQRMQRRQPPPESDYQVSCSPHKTLGCLGTISAALLSSVFNNQ